MVILLFNRKTGETFVAQGHTIAELKERLGKHRDLAEFEQMDHKETLVQVLRDLLITLEAPAVEVHKMEFHGTRDLIPETGAIKITGEQSMCLKVEMYVPYESPSV